MWCSVVVALLLLLLSEIFSKFSVANQEKHNKNGFDNCYYNFQVWKPEENVLDKMKEFEVALNHSKLNFNNDFLILKLQIRKQQDMIKSWSKNSVALRGRGRELNPGSYDLGEGDIDTKTLLAIMTSIKSSVSDLKGEWVLLKRQFNGIHSDNSYLKNVLKTTSDLASITKEKLERIEMESCAGNKLSVERNKLEEISQEVNKRYLVHIRKQLETISHDIENTEKEVRELRQENYNLRNQIFLLAMLFNHTEELPLTQIVEKIVSVDETHKKVSHTKTVYSDCEEARLDGHVVDGVYKLRLPGSDGKVIEVFCSMAEDGGWIVVQRRIDGSTDFNRNWFEYKHGFGNLFGEFWLGNDYMHQLTAQGRPYQMRIDALEFSNQAWYSFYNQFKIASEEEKYTLKIRGHQGPPDFGDSLSYNDGMKFSTVDRDNDLDIRNCAEEMKGGWWFKDGSYGYLNGIYRRANQSHSGDGIYWFTLHDNDSHLKKTVMKIKPQSE